MPELTLADVGPAVRAAWCLETCDDADTADWSPARPARGRCGATALTVHDLLGGELLVAEVREPRVVERPPGLPRRPVRAAARERLRRARRPG